MKIAFLSSIYVNHLEVIYKKHYGLVKKTFKEQHDIIKNETICSMGEWPDHFNEITVETTMLCVNNPFLQSAWCRENDFVPNETDSEFSIILEQIKRFQPTHLFIFGVTYYSTKNRLNIIESNCKSIRKKICWYGAPEGKIDIFKKYDLVLTPSVDLSKDLEKAGINSQVLEHAFEPRTLSLLNIDKRKNKFCFIGSLTVGADWHEKRIQYLERLSKEIDIDIYSNLEKPSLGQICKKKIISFRQQICKLITKYEKSVERINYYADETNLPDYRLNFESPIIKRIKPSVYGIDMLRVLSSYTLSFNMHIPLARMQACNMRLTEALGVGTCLVSDFKKNNSLYFSEYEKICTYESLDELVIKSKHLIENRSLTSEISENLQEKILSEKNTEKQFGKLINYIHDI